MCIRDRYRHARRETTSAAHCPAIRAGIPTALAQTPRGFHPSQGLETVSYTHLDVYKRQAKDKTSGFRLMGFGHRVYKNFDPRAIVMKESADEVLELLGIHNNPTLQVAKELERIALSDEYFISKKLYPNVDFYSGIILDAMGFPTSMFTPIFAISRTVGWIAQWKEMIAEKNQKIGRPR